jgi:hypothetical protein
LLLVEVNMAAPFQPAVAAARKEERLAFLMRASKRKQRSMARGASENKSSGFFHREDA